MSRCAPPGTRVPDPAESFSISWAYRRVPLTLSRLRSPAKMACISGAVRRVRSTRYPSRMEMPPPAPWVVTKGMPAWHRASTSRRMVRGETSNSSAKAGAVTFSRWSRMARMPMSRSNFMVVPPLQRAIFLRAPGPADGCLMGPVQNVLSLVYHRNRTAVCPVPVVSGPA